MYLEDTDNKDPKIAAGMWKGGDFTFATALLALLLLRNSRSEIHEVCDSNTFAGHCASDQVIVMKSARYGRMGLGRCVKVDLGYLGCSSDVLSLFDAWCSGKQSCDVFISTSNDDLMAESACTEGLLSHVELEYTCVNVIQPDATKCQAGQHYALTATRGGLASHITDQYRCGKLDNPWVIRTSPGQRIKVLMSDFGWQEQHTIETGRTCRPYGYISEPGLGVNHTLCGGLARETEAFMSSSGHVVIQLIPSNRRELKFSFLLQYEVLGCSDITPPAYAWYKRNDSKAVIGCEWSEHSWHLTCEGSSWVGVVGNCSSTGAAKKQEPVTSWTMSPLLSVSLIIGLGVLVVVLFCVALIGCVCILRARGRNSPAAFQPPEQQQSFLYYPGRPIPVDNVNHTLIGTNKGHAPITTQPTKPTATDELIHIWETPLPIPKQTQVSAGVSDSSTTMSGRGTLPGTPQVCKDGSTMSRSDYSTDTYWEGTDRYFDNDLGWVTMPTKE